MSHTRMAVFGIFMAGALYQAPAQANDRAFMNWCTQNSANSVKVCTCASQRIRQSTSGADLAAFLRNGGRIALDERSIATASAITKAIQVCKR